MNRLKKLRFTLEVNNNFFRLIRICC